MKKIVLFCLIIIMFVSTAASAKNVNPPREELERMIEEEAAKRGIPSVILKAIARVETVFRHFREDGTVTRGMSGSIGLMQIHNNSGCYDESRLINDIPYNIRVGADILLEKWDASVEDVLPSVGNMDPNILENWYFALWGYNSYVESNNPNMLPYHYSTYTKKYTYQDLIYMVAEEEYGQPINSIDKSLLPKSGVPERSLWVPSPEECHEGNIVQYKKGDIVFVDSYSNLNVRNEPNGKRVDKLSSWENIYITDGPVLKDGYYWYQVGREPERPLGWSARNWLTLLSKGNFIPEEEQQIQNAFTDIEDYWGKDFIVKLAARNILKGISENQYGPEMNVTKEQFAVLICRTLDKEGISKQLHYKDAEQVSDWAVPYVNRLVSEKTMELDNKFRFNPKENLTRREAAEIMSNLLEDPQDTKPVYFYDLTKLSFEQISDIRKVYYYGIMNGKSENEFAPEKPITRGEMAKILYLLREEINNKG